MTFSRGLGLLGPDTAMMARPPASLPTLDYRTLDFNYVDMFGPAEDQGQTSECYTYSPSGMFEAYHYRRLKTRLVVSKRAMASLTNERTNPGNTQDQGGFPSDVVQTFEGGYVLGSAWPDDTSDDTVQMVPVPADLLLGDFKAEGLVSVPTSVEGIVLAGHAHGPASICVSWPSAWYTDTPLDSNGILVPLSNPAAIGGHAICAVGHAPADKLFAGSPPATLIRNSWGAWAGGSHAPAGYAWAADSDLAQILIDGNSCMEVPS